MHKPPVTPRTMTKAEAASYAAGGSIYRFDRMRRLGIMPKKIPGTALFDRTLIDAALDKLAGAVAAAAPKQETALEKFKRERDERRCNDSKRQRH